MKRIIATTALALIMTGGGFAASAFAAQIGTYQSQPTDIRASQFIGQTIYATDTTPGDMVAVGAEKDWDNVGEINEVILGRDNTVKAVILGVGGFLGMGEKNVAVGINDVKFVKNGDGADDYFLVVNANKDSLTAAPAYVSAQEKQAAAEEAAPAANDTAANTMNDTTPAANDTAANTMDDTTTASTTTAADRSLLTRPDVTRDGYSAIQASELTPDKLEGARVYGPKDEDVGEINRIILSSDGKSVDRVVLDIGGFLGMGERQIAVTMDELNIVRSADGSDVRIYIDANQATLKAQPEFKG